MKKIVISLFIFLLVAPSLSLAAEGRDTAQQIKTFMKRSAGGISYSRGFAGSRI